MAEKGYEVTIDLRVTVNRQARSKADAIFACAKPIDDMVKALGALGFVKSLERNLVNARLLPANDRGDARLEAAVAREAK